MLLAKCFLASMSLSSLSLNSPACLLCALSYSKMLASCAMSTGSGRRMWKAGLWMALTASGWTFTSLQSSSARVVDTEATWQKIWRSEITPMYILSRFSISDHLYMAIFPDSSYQLHIHTMPSTGQVTAAHLKTKMGMHHMVNPVDAQVLLTVRWRGIVPIRETADGGDAHLTDDKKAMLRRLQNVSGGHENAWKASPLNQIPKVKLMYMLDEELRLSSNNQLEEGQMHTLIDQLVADAAWWGWWIGLPHSMTKDVSSFMGSLGALVPFLSAVPAIGPVVAAAAAAALGGMALAIVSVDQGKGVWVKFLWPAPIVPIFSAA
uniref:Uncharacterized protein n=1 Tax=Chlamydomonas euryale TaxID=1486919 RepID=A0A7R9YVP9_9CHLO|mmetsp:Transcript_29557/g.87427  ORF Transcript_29557/g.87427 Transcript_29557/m.87427 type:complete len:321 (+) Transcript_29557:628-1590(+)